MNNESDELNRHKLYQKVSEKYDGNWDGEEMSFSCVEGKVEVISLQFFENFFVGTNKVTYANNSVWRRSAISNDNFITIRLGSHGEIKERSKGTSMAEGIYIYNSQQPLTFNFQSDTEFEILAITFPYELIKKVNILNESSNLKMIFEKKDFFFQYFPMSIEIENLVRYVFEHRNNKELRKSIFISKAFEIIGRLDQKIVEKESVSTNLHPHDLEMMIDLKVKILQDYTIQPNLDIIASDLGMSKSKLQRSFKSVFKTSILKYFNSQRLEEARRKIEYTEDSLSYISYDLGFNDISHFSTAFKKHFGIAPSDVRENA
ncbi:AraC family transcriptional regulator [Flammeovirga sp. SJP92]|uniref:helix-turn-helix domain-containing protein n=1 Tax=Flammeovirga sp. SJP92 TaxID=1775430 RepID=UPI00078721B7|nr:AraC family transcriptional regulator [Flammeovirga sp. SJP92]KXX70549.1 hypothetical protein AVL50_08610 [Flammeovirga sp. SJP92]